MAVSNPGGGKYANRLSYLLSPTTLLEIMIQQLNPTIPVVTPKGKGNAVGWIDYGAEDDLYWIVFQTDTCECWIYPNKDIRAQENFTLGRKAQEPVNAQWEEIKNRHGLCSSQPRGDYSETLTTVPAGRPGK